MRKVLLLIGLLLQTLMYAQVAPMPQIRGRVLDRATNTAIAGAMVRIINTDSNNMVRQLVVTNREGQYSFQVSGLRNFRLDVEKTSYYPFSSSTFNTAVLARTQQQSLPDIFLRRMETDDMPATSDTLPPQVVIKSRMEQNDIYANEDVYELVYDLNPALDRSKPIPNNYPLVMPRFPQLDNAFKTESRVAHVVASLPSAAEATLFTNNNSKLDSSIAQLSGLAQVTEDKELQPGDFVKLKQSLSALQVKLDEFRPKAGKASKATLEMMNKPLVLLHTLTREAAASATIKKALVDKVPLIIEHLERLMQSAFKNAVGVHFLEVDSTGVSFGQGSLGSPAGLLFQAVALVGLGNEGAPAFEDIRKPKNFNIYVFVNGKTTPEEKRFEVHYFPPGLPELETPVGRSPASTSYASIPQAVYTFRITDANNNIQKDKRLDMEKDKDDMVTPNLIELLFGTRPYKLCFYLQDVR